MEGGEEDESECESGCESGGPRVAFTMGDSPRAPRENGGPVLGGPRAAGEGGRPGRPPGDPMASQTMEQFYSFAPEPLHHFEHVKAGHRWAVIIIVISVIIIIIVIIIINIIIVIIVIIIIDISISINIIIIIIGHHFQMYSTSQICNEAGKNYCQ